METGGWSEEMPATPEIQEICDKVKEEVEKQAMKQADKPFEMYKALTFRTQVVSGTNHRVKIQVSSDWYHVYATIYQHLPCHGGHLEVTDVQSNIN